MPTQFSMGDETALDGGSLDRLLQLFKRAHFDLANPLPRDAVLLRQILEGGRILPQTSLGQNVAFTIIQVGHRLFKQIAAYPELLPFPEPGFLALALVNQPILPLAFAIAPKGSIERMVGARQAAVHADDIGLRNIEFGGDLLQIFG